jgi:cytochrome d ubiquinol oxidase subunit I
VATCNDGWITMFEGWDAAVLARAQFAFTMSFHIVFPAFTIGIASYLAVLEALWLSTGREVFINLFNYWLKISPSLSAWASYRAS